MKSIIANLDPSKNYSFLTSLSGRSYPCTVKQFMESKYINEHLVSISEGFGPDSIHVWSTYSGWNVDAFSALVKSFVSLIDKTEKVNPEFIDCVTEEGISVLQAVFNWFHGTEISVEVTQHADGISGLLDVEIEGIGTVRRAVLGMNIKNGDMFNVYYGENSKGAAIWKGDLVSSLSAYVAPIAA